MTLDHSRFKNIAAGIQSLAIVGAIIVGGVWGILTLEAQRARGEYERLLRELREHRVVNISIDAQAFTDPSEGHRCIIAVMSLENAGRTTEILRWPETPLTVARVSLRGAEAPTLLPASAYRMDPKAESTLTETGLRLMPGVRIRRVFVAQVTQAGVYHLSFNVLASMAEQELAAEEGVFGGVVFWGEDSFVVVP